MSELFHRDSIKERLVQIQYYDVYNQMLKRGGGTIEYLYDTDIVYDGIFFTDIMTEIAENSKEFK